MKYVRLVATDDQYDTELGLVLKGTPITDDLMADRNGQMIAHDLVEHQNGPANIGTVWDEMQALGGIWHTRGRHGDFTSGYWSPHQTIAHDLARMYEEDDCMDVPALHTCPHECDEDFEHIISLARPIIMREAYDEEDADPDRIDAFLQPVIGHMRTGYRKATKRFGHDYESNNLYHAIKRAWTTPEYAGQEFILAYGNGQANIYAN